MWVRNRAGEEMELLATCHNLNSWGIGVICELMLEEGTQLPIAIHQPEATYHGTGVVRHCTSSDGEYFVGIELVESVPG